MKAGGPEQPQRDRGETTGKTLDTHDYLLLLSQRLFHSFFILLIALDNFSLICFFVLFLEPAADTLVDADCRLLHLPLPPLTLCFDLSRADLATLCATFAALRSTATPVPSSR